MNFTYSLNCSIKAHQHIICHTIQWVTAKRTGT